MGDIKFDIGVLRNNITKIYKLFIAFDILPINAKGKSVCPVRLRALIYLAFIFGLALLDFFSKCRAICRRSMTQSESRYQQRSRGA